MNTLLSNTTVQYSTVGWVYLTRKIVPDNVASATLNPTIPYALSPRVSWVPQQEIKSTCNNRAP